MQEAASWREFLATIIKDPTERQRLVNILGINAVTLGRWANRTSTPRPQNLQQLLRALPQHHTTLFALLSKEFPDLSIRLFEEASEDHREEIPSEFYRRILDSYIADSSSGRFWSISALILQQALGHLDPHQLGMAMIVATCVPPARGEYVRSLRLHTGRGTLPWQHNLEQQMLLLGVESLAGYAFSSAHPMVVQSRDEQGSFPVHWNEMEQSIAAYPIMTAEARAGSIIFASAQPQYFLPFRQALMQSYTNLMVLAFDPEDWYSEQAVNLQPMPHYHEQQAYAATFRQRVADVMRKATHQQRQIAIMEAERLVWQEIEDIFCHLPAYIDKEENDKKTQKGLT